MPDPQQREAALFALVLESPVSERAALLNAICGEDPVLRQRLEALLAAHDQPEDLEPAQAGAVRPTIKLDFTEAPPDEAVGQTLGPQNGLGAGRYKLLERIGEGGCGVVYVAEQTEPVRRRVALKVIKLGMDTKQVVARFEAERQALAMMDHPNIAKVLDAGMTLGAPASRRPASEDGKKGEEQAGETPALPAGRPFFVMELVRGIRITDYCDQANCTTQERLDLFIKVCHAIQHAHQKGIIHRDIKPSNILVTLHDGVPVPKVIDFGIAKATEGRLTDSTVYTQLHQFIGTPAYMSPEQAEMSGLDIDTRSDIYSLGVLLYELLAGSTPFDAKELMASGIDAMRRTIREKEPPRPSTRLATLGVDQLTTTARRRSADTSKLLHQLKGDLDWIVMKCLEKDRQRRYETANGLAADIKRHLSNEPVIARPPSATYKFQKAFRRNKLVFAAGAIVGVALLLGTGISTWQALLARRARQQEAQANARLRGQIQETDWARQAAEKAALAESRQRARAEELLQAMQFQKAEDLLSTGPSVSGLTLLGQMLRANPSNAVAASRFASALLVADRPPLSESLRHGSNVNYAEFSPDGQRVVTASDDQTARVWDAHSSQPLTAPLRHEGKVSSAVFSPDGQRVVTASFDKTARVWDARSGQPLTEPLRHGDALLSAEFSPDGQRVVTASGDKTARVWDARSGQPLTEPLRHESGVNAVQFSLDGERVVTASYDKTARVWDARSGRAITAPLRHEDVVLSARFSPDGQRVVTASQDKTARVWDARSGQPLTEPFRHEDQVISADFSPDGQRVVTVSGLTARIWDARSGQAVSESLGHKSGVSTVQFSPDGQRVVTASWDGAARVWDARSGQPLTDPLRHEGMVVSARFSPDGQRVVTASYDKTARVWDTRPTQPLTELLGHEDWLLSAEFSPDGQRVVTASEDKTARVWDARSGQPLTEPLRHEKTVLSTRFSPDSQRVVTASFDRTARVWDARSGQPLTEPLRHEDTVFSARFSPDGQRVVTASWDKTARVWDARSGQPLTEPLRHEGQVISAQFSPDGQQVVTASADKTARVWDARSGQPLTEPLRHEDAVSFVEFSSDGQRVVTASTDKTARVWDARSGQPLTEPLRHEGYVFSARFSPDGQRVVTSSEDRTARVWDARSGQALTEPLRHGDTVYSAQFSPDGQRVATASTDKTARVWDARSGQALTEPLRHQGQVVSAQFSPDGQRVVTASEDKTARVWEVPVPPVPAPAWFLDWAEARIGRRFDPRSAAGAVPLADLRRQQDLAAARTDADFYTRLAHWAQADPSTRTLSPQAKLTVPEYIQQRIQENTLASLREAVRIAPTNALAWARLALAEMVQDAKQHPGRWDEAAFSARQALQWDPQNGEAWHARAAVEQGTGQADQAMISLEKSLQLDPVNRGAWELKGRLLTQTGRPAEALAAYQNPLAALPAEPVAAFQARVDLLKRHLATLAQSRRPQGTEVVQREVVRWLVGEILACGQRLAVPGLPGLLEPLKELAASCSEAGYAAECEPLRTRLDEARRRSAVAQPGDLLPALNISSLDAWLGREQEYAATCASILEFAKDTKDPNLAERAAKICSLLPTDDRTRETALMLARRAVALGKGERRFSFMLLALGMAEYRNGHWREAEQVLAAATETESGKDNSNVTRPVSFFRAMALFRQDKPAEARQLLSETAAKMKPLPKDPNDPLAGGVDDAVLIHWLAYKEAMALLGSEGNLAPAAKP